MVFGYVNSHVKGMPLVNFMLLLMKGSTFLRVVRTADVRRDVQHMKMVGCAEMFSAVNTMNLRWQCVFWVCLPYWILKLVH